jgi:NET1-associated nuclear protein 1 (U3 small nucleolar RNA-associated protein 17)
VDDSLTGVPRFLILAQESLVQVFSVETSLLVRSLKVLNSETISTYALSAAIPSQLYAVTSSGSAYCWNWATGETIENVTVSPGVVGLGCFPFEYDGVQRDVLFTLHSEESSVLKAYRTPRNSPYGLLEEKVIFQSKNKTEFFKAEHGGKFIALAAGTTLILGLTEKLDTKSLDSVAYIWRQVPVSERIRSLALRVQSLSAKKKGSASMSKFGLDLVLGGQSGAIMVFDNVLNSLLNQEKAKGDAGNSLVPKRMHWHREPVNAVQWSRDGKF